jgi:hypothetical protein
MDSVKISFGNHNGFLIQNARSKSDIISRIHRQYKLDIFNMYEKHYSDHLLNVLSTKPMVVCGITKGKPYILYLTKLLNDNVALLIDLESKDKSIPKIVSVPLSADPALFSDTVLYGELLKHSGKWTFLIESCKVFRGKSTFHTSHLDNLKLCTSLVHDSLIPTPLMPFHIKMKRFFSISNIQNVIPTLKYDIIGIKFLGLRTPIVFHLYSRSRNTTHTIPISLYPPLTYNHIKEEKKELQLAFVKQYGSANNDFERISTLFEMDIDIEQPFDLILHTSGAYGIFNVGCDTGIIGIARITTIELHLEIIKIFKHTNCCHVSAFYNYNYDKWDILQVYTKSVPLSMYSTIKLHTEAVQTIPKANYLITQN